MDYWAETMKDDLYILVEDGWQASLEPVKDAKGKIRKGEYDCELVPKSLVIGHYFQAEKTALEGLEQELEAVSRNMEELQEEHGGEEGLLRGAQNDNGKVSKAGLSSRIREIRGKREYAEELEVLQQYEREMDRESALKNAIKDAAAALDQQVNAKYPALSEAEIKTLVVDEKWLTAIRQAIQTEIDGISQRLTRRIVELAERYESTLPALEREVEELSGKGICASRKNGVGMEVMNTKTEVRLGYKKTEVGVIPKDWLLSMIDRNYDSRSRTRTPLQHS